MGAIGRHRNAVANVAALGLPLGVAAALVPFRSSFANTASALVLVAVVVGIAVIGNRTAGFLATVSATLWFDFFLTRPYERLAITHRPDIETAVSLFVVGIVVTELAARNRHHQEVANRGVRLRRPHLQHLGARLFGRTGPRGDRAGADRTHRSAPPSVLPLRARPARTPEDAPGTKRPRDHRGQGLGCPRNGPSGSRAGVGCPGPGAHPGPLRAQADPGVTGVVPTTGGGGGHHRSGRGGAEAAASIGVRRRTRPPPRPLAAGPRSPSVHHEEMGAPDPPEAGPNRMRLGSWPTPVEPAPRLAERLGLDPGSLWIKRDDLTGLGAGGNKVRKLEYLCAAALESGATMLVTSGERRATMRASPLAAACRLGMDCVVVRPERRHQFRRKPGPRGDDGDPGDGPGGWATISSTGRSKSWPARQDEVVGVWRSSRWAVNHVGRPRLHRLRERAGHSDPRSFRRLTDTV